MGYIPVPILDRAVLRYPTTDPVEMTEDSRFIVSHSFVQRDKCSVGGAFDELAAIIDNAKGSSVATEYPC
jgi:hypothetical protein